MRMIGRSPRSNPNVAQINDSERVHEGRDRGGVTGLHYLPDLRHKAGDGAHGGEITDQQGSVPERPFVELRNADRPPT
jgi:hypothetical protein